MWQVCQGDVSSDTLFGGGVIQERVPPEMVPAALLCLADLVFLMVTLMWLWRWFYSHLGVRLAHTAVRWII